MENRKEYLILAEVDKPIFHRKLFPYYAFVYMVQLNNDYTGLISSDFNPELIGLDTDLNINSVNIKSVIYSEVFSLAEVIGIQSSYFYDYNNRILYIHYVDDLSPHAFTDAEHKISLTQGFYKTNVDGFNGIVRNQQYYGRLKSTSKVSYSKDDLFYSKQKFVSNSIDINNSDYRFVNYNIGASIEQKKYGGLVRIKVFSGEDIKNIDYYTDFTTIYQGRIDKITESETLTLNLADLRKQYDKTSPLTTFALIDNLYGESGLSEDPINPQIWGICKDIPTICLNKESDDTLINDYYFLVCSNHRAISSTAINKVYIDGILQTTLSTGGVSYLEVFETDNAYLVKINKGYFEFVDDSGALTYKGMDKLTFDMTGYVFGDGYDSNRGLYIASAILNDNYDITLTSTFYEDISAFLLQADESYQIGYYLDKPMEVYKQLEELSVSMMGALIVTPDLKLRWETDDEDPTTLDIPISALLGSNYIPKIVQDPSEVLAEVRCGYLKKWKSDTYEYFSNNDNEESALINFNSRKSKDFHTLISSQSDAENYIARLKIYTDSSKDTVSFTTLLNNETAVIGAGDYIEVYIDLPNQPILGRTIQQIQSISFDYERMTVDITGRIMRIGNEYLLLDENNKIITDENNDFITVEISEE